MRIPYARLVGAINRYMVVTPRNPHIGLREHRGGPLQGTAARQGVWEVKHYHYLAYLETAFCCFDWLRRESTARSDDTGALPGADTVEPALMGEREPPALRAWLRTVAETYPLGRRTGH